MATTTKLSSSDWTAIKWYANEYGYKIKDMFVWPLIRLRNSENEVVDINISDIKAKYKGRPKGKKPRA